VDGNCPKAKAIDAKRNDPYVSHLNGEVFARNGRRDLLGYFTALVSPGCRRRGGGQTSRAREKQTATPKHQFVFSQAKNPCSYSLCIGT
jgi:hypothetical protein